MRKILFIPCLFIGSQVFALTAPTLTSVAISTINDTATRESTSSLTWNNGDIIYVIGVGENNSATLTTPAGNGLTFSIVISSQVAGQCSIYCWKATAASARFASIISTGPSSHHGIMAYAFGNCGGNGMTATVNNITTLTISLALRQSNSAVIVGMGDFSGTANESALTITPAGGVTDANTNSSGSYTALSSHWGDRGTAGTASYGWTGQTGSPIIFGEAIEIFGVAGASIPPNPTRKIIITND